MSLFRPKARLEEILSHALFIDTETAGLDPHVNGILSVGAATLDGKEFYAECHLYTFQKAEKAALKINGFTEEDCKDIDGRDSAHEMVRKFIEWYRSILSPERAKLNPLGYIVGKNAKFDYDMMASPWTAVFAKDGPSPEPFPLSHRVIDLTSLAAFIYIKQGIPIPIAGIDSGTLQKYLEMPEEAHPHQALEGARYHREMLLRLINKL